MFPSKGVRVAEVDDECEAAARAYLCGELDQLRVKADRDGWRADLDEALTMLRAGRSAVQTLCALGLPAPADGHLGRGVTGPGSLRGISMPPMLIEGDYCCPHRMCARRARPGPDWAEPRCVDGTPMLLRPA